MSQFYFIILIKIKFNILFYVILYLSSSLNDNFIKYYIFNYSVETEKINSLLVEIDKQSNLKSNNLKKKINQLQMQSKMNGLNLFKVYES